MGKSLKLVNKDKKKDFFINTPYKQKKSKSPKSTPLIYADNDDNVYKTFFMEIKNQWSFSWRLEILCISIMLIVGTLFYFDIYYINWSCIKNKISITN